MAGASSGEITGHTLYAALEPDDVSGVSSSFLIPSRRHLFLSSHTWKLPLTLRQTVRMRRAQRLSRISWLECLPLPQTYQRLFHAPRMFQSIHVVDGVSFGGGGVHMHSPTSACCQVTLPMMQPRWYDAAAAKRGLATVHTSGPKYTPPASRWAPP